MDFAKGKSQNRVNSRENGMLQDLKGQTNGKYYVQQFIAPELEKKKKTLVEEVKNKAGSAKELLLQ